MAGMQETDHITLKNGVTYLLQDAKARAKLAELLTELLEKYGPDNPPPYPVTSVNGETGDVSIDTGVTSIRADYPGGGTGVNKGDVSIAGSGCLVHTIYPGRVEVQASKNTIGLGNVANERQYSANNPPPYPVTSVNGQTGAVTVPTVTLPLAVSEGGTGATTPSGIRSSIGVEFGTDTTARVMFVSYGGQNGVETRIYGSDNTVYSLAVYVNALALNVSTDGGATWTNMWVAHGTVSAALVCEYVSTSSGARYAWPIGSNLPPLGGSLTLTVRNATTGAVYAVWYYSTDQTFEIAAILAGSAPNAGDVIFVQYQV